MDFSGPLPAKPQAIAPPLRLNRDAVSLAGDLLPLIDVGCLLLAAYAGAALYSLWFAALAEPFGWASYGSPLLLGAVLAPFMLHERARHTSQSFSFRRHAARFVLFGGALFAIGLLVHGLDVPREWLIVWMALTFALTAASRALLSWNLRALEQRGLIAETVAVVGAAPALGLLQDLQHRARRLELLGVFADDDEGSASADGTIDDLLELGKTRSIDWILLALPPDAQHRVPELLRRLKGLSANIGICPETSELGLPCARVDYVGDGVPVRVVTDRRPERWRERLIPAEDLVPRWVATSLMLPGLLWEVLHALLRARQGPAARRRRDRLVWKLDDYTLEQFTALAALPSRRYRYVVTPNADHLIRLHENPAFRALYAAADYVLLDSRFIARLLRLIRRIDLPVCTGSDLTAHLFEQVIEPDDPLVLIGGSEQQAQALVARYRLRQLAHFNPPMGFIHDPQAVRECLAFAEAHSPFRFCLLAVGSPQQEILARELKARGVARGLALCIGASINFLTGEERRAPAWVQRLALEWLYRLLQAPRRMAYRYLVRGPRLFGLLRKTEIVLRSAHAATPQPLPALGRGHRPQPAGGLGMARTRPGKARPRSPGFKTPPRRGGAVS